MAGLAAVTMSASLFAAGVPEFRTLSPHGGQRGTEVRVQVRGERLKDLQEVFVYEPGLTVKKIEGGINLAGSNRDDSAVLTFQIAPDARLGEYHFSLRTPGGVTWFQNFYVGPFPTEEEKTDFTEDKPMKVQKMNVTVEGALTAEDEDFFAVQLKKGQRLTLEVEGFRLAAGGGNYNVFDPHLEIRDAEGFTIVSSDDTALLRQDPVISFIAPQDAEYLVALRDSEYAGGSYRLHVGDFPRPTAVYPAGGQAGESVKAVFLGDPQGAIEAMVTLPDKAGDPFRAVPQRGGLSAPSGNLMRVSAFPNVLEQEPNDSVGKLSAGAAAVPAAFNGIIEQVGDVDHFRFTAKKSQPMEVNVLARAIRTPLDPTLTILDAAGKTVASNDDSGGELDSYLRFNPPADGEYVLQVKDQLGRGGADFVYRVEVAAAEPSLSFVIPEVQRRDTRTRQWVAVPRGGHYAVRLLARRNNADGDITLSGEGLPQGVTMHAPTMKEGANDQAVVFSAAPDAPIAGKLWSLRGTAGSDKKQVEGRFIHQADIVRGNPNGASYYAVDLDRMAVVVVDQAPFSVRIQEPKIPLLQSGSMDLKVAVERQEGYKEPIRFSLTHLPPGITAQSEITIPADKTEGRLTINASRAAQTGQWQIAMTAYGDHKDGGRLYVSTPLAKLEVAGAYVAGKFQLATVEAGGTVKVVCDLEQRNDFEGKAKLELLGLPAKATAEPVMIGKDDKQAVFTVKTDAATPLGQNKSLIAQMTLEKHGEPIVQTVASNGLFRVDKPKATASAAGGNKPAKTAK
jgi:hypothetical protein